MKEKIVCVKPIEGYLTENKEYDFEKIELYADRAVIAADDNGREAHHNQDRFTLYGIPLELMLKMYKVKLTRVESTHQNLQRSEMMCRTPNLPKVGSAMMFYGDSLARYQGPSQIVTSFIKEVSFDKESGTFTVKTNNSTYTIEYLDKNERD